MAIFRVRIQPHDPQDVSEPNGHHGQGEPSGWPRAEACATALVSSSFGNSVCTASEETLEDISLTSFRDIQWYFEQYPTYDSFATRRAEAIGRRLREHGRRLLREYFHPNILPTTASDSHVLIEVYSDATTLSANITTPLTQLHWEILEDEGLWQDVYSFQPLSVHVIRAHPTNGGLLSPPSGPIRAHSPVRWNVRNVLAITARPSHIKDIPHRLITRSIAAAIEELPEASSKKVSLEIVRPGSFKALECHLEKHPFGYFDVVHLDMHGDAHLRGSNLTFVRYDNDMRPHADERSTEELAALLVSHGVNTVVINACRSAANSKESSNTAAMLVKAGIHSAVGMSFNVLSWTAGEFMKEFYRCLIGQGFSAIRATSNARKHVRQQKSRTTRFHTTISLEDHVIPIVHCSESTLQEVRRLQLDSQIDSNDPDVQDRKPDLIGREGPILQLESLLAQPQKLKIHLKGPPGIGKTSFLKHAGAWWQKTGLCHGVIHAELDRLEYSELSLDKLATLLMEQLYQTSTTSSSSTQLVEELNKGRWILILDSMDSVRWDSSMRVEEHHQQLKGFLRELKSSSVILASRTDDTWLDYRVQYWLSLDGLDYSTSAQLGLNLLAENGIPKSVLATVEDHQLFEQLIEMARGNPLAIKMIVSDLTHRISNEKLFKIESHIISLFQFRPIFIGPEFVESDSGARSIPELLSILSTIETEAAQEKTTRSLSRFELILATAAFWHHMPVHIEPFTTVLTVCRMARKEFDHAIYVELRIFLRKLVEEMADSNSDEPVFTKLNHPTKGYPKAFATVLNLCRSAASTMHSQLSEVVEGDLATFSSPLITHSFGQSKSSYQRSYFTLSPILTLVFKSSVFEKYYAGDFSVDLEVARASLFNFNVSKWVSTGAHIPNIVSPARDAMRMELDWDFSNFASWTIAFQALQSWPNSDDWLLQFLIYEAACYNGQRSSLVDVIMQRFILTTMDTLVKTREKYYRPQLGEYDMSSLDTCKEEWQIAAGIEVAYTLLLPSIIRMKNLAMRSDDREIEYWKFLVKNPMFTHAKDLDSGLRDLMLATHNVNSKVSDLASSTAGLTRERLDEVNEAYNQLFELLRDGFDTLLDFRAEGYEPDRDDPTREITLKALRSQSPTLEKLVELVKPLKMQEDASKVTDKLISDMENLLQEEVEGSNQPFIRLKLHENLIGMYRVRGNPALAIQHEKSRKAIASELNPAVLAQMDRRRDQWEVYFRNNRLKDARFRTETEKQEHQLSEELERLRGIESHSPDDTVALSACLLKIGDALSNLSQYAEAANCYKRVIQERLKVLPPDHADVLSAKFALAKALSRLGQYDQSIPILRAVRDGLEGMDGNAWLHRNVTASLGIALTEVATSSTKSMDESARTAMLQEAKECYSACIKFDEESMDINDQAGYSVKAQLALVYLYEGDYAQAETMYREAIEISKARTGNPDLPYILTSQNDLAYLQFNKLGKLEEAIEMFRYVLSRRLHSWGPRNVDTLLSFRNLFWAYRRTDRTQEAQELVQGFVQQYRKSVEDVVTVNTGVTIEVETALRRLAESLTEIGAYLEAKLIWDEILDMLRADVSRQQELAQLLDQLAVGCSREAMVPWDRIHALRSEEIALLSQLNGASDDRTLAAISAKQSACTELHRIDEALELQKVLVAAKEAKLGPDNIVVLQDILNLGILYVDAQDWPAAEANCRHAYSGLVALDENGPQVGLAAGMIAVACYNQEQFDAAVHFRREQVRACAARDGPDSQTVLAAREEESLVLSAAARHDEAIAMIRSVYAHRQRTLVAGHYDVLFCLFLEARYLVDAGRLDEAERVAKQLLEVCAAYPAADVISARGHACLSRLYEKRGETESALAAVGEALKLWRALRSDMSTEVLATCMRRTEILISGGRFDEAETTAQDALEEVLRDLGEWLRARRGRLFPRTAKDRLREWLEMKSKILSKDGRLKKRKSEGDLTGMRKGAANAALQSLLARQD